jgi:hypothetical protein
MSSDYCSQLELFDCIHNFVVDGASNELTESHWNDFERLLREDDDALRLYIEYVEESDLLQAIMDATPDEDSLAPDVFSLELQDHPSVHAPVPTFPAILWHGTVGYFSSGWPVAYLVATVIYGIGLLIGSFTYVSHPTPIARDSAPLVSPLSPLPSPISPHSSVVGQITGMVDCKLAGTERVSREVSLNFSYQLVSGLMEITYNSGAKVILQGPVTYKVDSADGGYLSLGKLTARVEKKAEGGGRKAESSSLSTIHYPLSTASSPLFSVRTPTAVFIDLGTEFGVEVSKSGTSEVCVLKGTVRGEFLDADGHVLQTVELKEGEGRRYEQASGRATVIAVDRASFAKMQILGPEGDRCQRWLDYSHRLRKDPSLVAYYTFESMEGDGSVLPNVSTAGRAMDGTIKGARWTVGRFPGKMALSFHGYGTTDRVELPEPERFNFTKAFSVAVWFQIPDFSRPDRTLIAKGDKGYRLLQREDIAGITFDTDYGVDGNSGKFYPIFGSGVIDTQWHHAVAVFSGDYVGRKRLYIDGQLDIRGDVPPPLTQNNEPVWIGNNSQHPDRALFGLIDEVAIFDRALPAEEIKTMYDAGDPRSGAAKRETGN